MSHFQSSTAVACRDSALAKQIRVEEVCEGWDLTGADTVENILGSNDSEIAFCEDHPELGSLGSMSFEDLKSALEAAAILARESAANNP